MKTLHKKCVYLLEGSVKMCMLIYDFCVSIPKHNDIRNKTERYGIPPEIRIYLSKFCLCVIKM